VATEGDISVMGHNGNKNFDKTRQLVGYCPQHDIFFDGLTVIQHLQFICVLKRLPIEKRAIMCERTLYLLNLGIHHDRLAATLTPCNKRKLSVAMAVIGNPPVLLFDDPSAGMDPESRRAL